MELHGIRAASCVYSRFRPARFQSLANSRACAHLESKHQEQTQRACARRRWLNSTAASCAAAQTSDQTRSAAADAKLIDTSDGQHRRRPPETNGLRPIAGARGRERRDRRAAPRQMRGGNGRRCLETPRQIGSARQEPRRVLGAVIARGRRHPRPDEDDDHAHGALPAEKAGLQSSRSWPRAPTPSRTPPAPRARRC